MLGIPKAVATSLFYLITSVLNKYSSSFHAWAVLGYEAFFFFSTFLSILWEQWCLKVCIPNKGFVLRPTYGCFCVLGWYLLTTYFTLQQSNHKCFISNVSQVFPVQPVLSSHWGLQLCIIDGDQVDGDVVCCRSASRFWRWNRIIKCFHYCVNRPLGKGCY